MDRNHLLLSVKLLESYIQLLMCLATISLWLIEYEEKEAQRRDLSESTLESRLDTISKRSTEIHRITHESDENCINELCMDRNAFARLCELLETRGGLLNDGLVTIEEQVAIFLNILAHHKKQMGNSKSLCSSSFRCFDAFARDIGCLGAIDGTYIEVNVHDSDTPRYRTRKGNITMNVLGVYNHDMNFVYVLAGWEGSTTDSRVLRDAITRHNGLKIPIGNYSLADGGYFNGEDFLAPYRGIRYHLREWECSTRARTNKEEYFNMKHSQARNVIERCFDLLKRRWAILRSPSFYPIRIQGRIVMTRALLHNFIRTHMDLDPEENTSSTFEDMPIEEEQPNHFQIVDVVESSNEWTQWRDDLAQEIRQWTQEEEDALITILQDIVVIGGRGDNGSFRPGTYDQVVLKLREKVGINITAKHVQNKIKRLQDKFSAAYDMQNTRGFGWDDARKCVVVDSAEILEEYLKKHPNKKYVANNPFLAYEQLANVFGKDRATRAMAESTADVTENQNVDNE
uniref:Myb/SANT-like domain-containing protein n=1 Tax=Lactuca sativa TaxID=4236 RepID=A0A9R1X6I9_LACSA|nr:hypothetical protein LSAT_V11C600338210 [Lactuca sativa]